MQSLQIMFPVIGDQLNRLQSHAEVCRSLPRIVCGEVMVAEPRAPELFRIWAIPKNRYKNILCLLSRRGTVGFILV